MSLVGEKIVAMKEHHNDEWIMLKMKSGKIFKFTSMAYYGGESDVNYFEVDNDEWEKH